jgi:hypothetical protein
MRQSTAILLVAVTAWNTGLVSWGRELSVQGDKYMCICIYMWGFIWEDSTILQSVATFCFFFGQSFPHLWVNFWIGISNCMYPPILALYLPSMTSPLLSASLMTWSTHHVHGLPMGLLPLIFISNNLSGILCLSIFFKYVQTISVYLFSFVSVLPLSWVLH